MLCNAIERFKTVMESGGFTPTASAPVEQDNVGTSASSDKNEMFCQRAMMITDNSDVTRRRR